AGLLRPRRSRERIIRAAGYEAQQQPQSEEAFHHALPYLFFTANKRLSNPAALAVLTILLMSRTSVCSSACKIARPSGQILPGAGRMFCLASSHDFWRSFGSRPRPTLSLIYFE